MFATRESDALQGELDTDEGCQIGPLDQDIAAEDVRLESRNGKALAQVLVDSPVEEGDLALEVLPVRSPLSARANCAHVWPRTSASTCSTYAGEVNKLS